MLLILNYLFRAPSAPKGRKYGVIIYSTNIYWVHTSLGTADTAVHKLDRLSFNEAHIMFVLGRGGLSSQNN